MLPDAVWIWDHAPLLPYVEFPWRLLGPATLCVAMLAAGLAPMLDSLRAWRRPAAIAAALALLIVPNLPHLRPPRIADVDLAFWTPHELAVRGFESTTLGEVTPRWMTAVPPYEPRAAAVVSGDAVTQEIGRTPFSWSGKVQARTESRVGCRSRIIRAGAFASMDVPRRRSRRPAAGWSSSRGVRRSRVEVMRSPARRLGEGIAQCGWRSRLVSTPPDSRRPGVRSRRHLTEIAGALPCRLIAVRRVCWSTSRVTGAGRFCGRSQQSRGRSSSPRRHAVGAVRSPAWSNGPACSHGRVSRRSSGPGRHRLAATGAERALSLPA